MNGKPTALDRPFLLLGEGTGELKFFADLLREMSITTVQVESYEGKNKLGDYLKDLKNLSGFSQLQRLAITRDADDSPAGAATSIESAVTAAGFPAELAVKSFVLPGGGRKGALESLWLETLERAPYVNCVKSFFDCLEKEGWFPSQVFAKKDKAVTQAWLATKDPPNAAFHWASAYGRSKKGRTRLGGFHPRSIHSIERVSDGMLFVNAAASLCFPSPAFPPSLRADGYIDGHS